VEIGRRPAHPARKKAATNAGISQLASGNRALKPDERSVKLDTENF
jgi:hypothetical protein